MNVKQRLSRSHLNLSQKDAPHFHRSYNNLNDVQQQNYNEYTIPTTKYDREQQQQQQQKQQAGRQWFRNNDGNKQQYNGNWSKYNAYDTPNFVPASVWMNTERFLDMPAKQPAEKQQQYQQNSSRTLYNVHNNHSAKERATIGLSTTTIQPLIKIRTNVQGLPYTPQAERRQTNIEQRAIQAVLPLNDDDEKTSIINIQHQTS